MTQEIYQEAIKFAGEKHKNQQVPGTEANYLLHISNVAMEIFTAYIIQGDFKQIYIEGTATDCQTIKVTVTCEDFQLFSHKIYY